MPLDKAELIIHPIRLRIIGALQSRALTVKHLGQLLPEVPQATLYRQIKRLCEGNVVQVTEERLVNGIVEKVYAVPAGAAHFSREEFAAISPVEHARYFSVCLGVLMTSMSRYLAQESFNTTEDAMTYFQAVLHLSDEEARQFRLDLLELVNQVGSKEPAPGRRRRTLGAAFIPDPKEE